jgi:small-conductance mechanosensitive channel
MKRKALLIIACLPLLFIFTLNSQLFAQAKPEKAVQAPGSERSKTVKNELSALTETIQDSKPEWSLTFGKVFWSAVVLLAGWLAIKYLTRLSEAIAERWVPLRFAIKRLIPMIRIGGWTLVIYIVIADVLAPPIATLVALTASAGIAVGFASQDILKNIFGGVMILVDRPFQVGDKIEVGKYYGEVLNIGLRAVRIVTPDDSQVSIPNSEMVNQSVSNANSGENNCQVVAEFYFPPHIDLVKAKKIAYRAAAASRYIYMNKPISIIVKNEINEGRSLLKMRLKAYVLDIRYEFPFSSEMTERVMSEFLKRGLVTPRDLAFVHSKADAAPG